MTFPVLQRDPAGPIFAEPWQAQAFALALHLHESGAFSWSEWSAALASELQRHPKGDSARYYEHWLTALERLLCARGITDPSVLLERRHAWAEAYRRTPHGTPVIAPNSKAV
jgi:nitrile hydratase accessory protein